MAKLKILEHSNVCPHILGLPSKIKVEAILEKEDIRQDYNYVITVFANGKSVNKIEYCNFLGDARCNICTDASSISKIMRIQCICELNFNIPENLNIDSLAINLNGFTLDDCNPEILDIFSWKTFVSEEIEVTKKEGE